MSTLPRDPMLLLSVVNTKLRDFYPDLLALCEDLNVEEAWITALLRGIDYEYDPERNQFV